MFLKHLLPLAALALLGAPAHAQITVDRSVIEFSRTAPVQDLEIFNGGRDKIYLDMAVAEIVDPASDEPTRVEFDDPRQAPVLVSPRQLLVPPGTRKRVRVIMRAGADETDRVFRLKVSPYTGKASLVDPSAGDKASAIKVLIGYDLLLISRPADLRPDIEVTRDETTIEFRNAGNTNVLLRRIVQCEPGVEPAAGPLDDACAELQPNRLYAGETYRAALPKPGPAERFPVRVWKAVGLDNSSDIY